MCKQDGLADSNDMQSSFIQLRIASFSISCRLMPQRCYLAKANVSEKYW